MRALLSWASSIIFLACLLLVLYRLAHKSILGFPDEPEKNVSLIPSSPPPGDVTLLFEPPMATRQIQGQYQDLSLQFSNKSKTAAELLPVRVEPQRCFSLEPLGGVSGVLQAGETVVKLDRLRILEVPDCVGESPLILVYAWRPVAAPAKPALAKRSARRSRMRRVKPPAAPALQERSIATSPIRITNQPTYYGERFVRIGQLVLLPVLLAILTFIFQRLQAARDAAQSEQNLRIEVWKIIHPTFLSMVKRYYAPLTRRMMAIIGQIEDGGQPETILVLLLLLRRQMLRLLDKDAGYYFQSKPGEEICGILNDALVHLWRARLGKSFDEAALLLSGREAAQEAEQLLLASQVDIAAWAARLFKKEIGQPDPSEFIDHALRLFVTVLAFESDRPFDAVWYDAEFPPMIGFAELGVDLDWLQKGDQVAMKKALNEYRTSIPWRCVSDKSMAIWLNRILLRIPLVRSAFY